MTPGLIVRKRVRVDLSEDEEEEESRSKVAKMDNLQASMNKVLNELTGMKATVATKDDMKRVSGRLDMLENTQQSMAVSQIEIKKRIEALEKGKPPPNTPQSSRDFTQSDKAITEYMDARRSLCMSPVMPYLPNIKDFLLSKMCLPEDLASDLEITKIRRIHPRKLPAHRESTDESRKVQVSFRDSHERDVVISYATNLQPGNRIEIVVPEHLKPLKSQLDGLSYKIRRHASITSQRKVMTSLRLDDRSQSLVVAVRDKKEDPWLNYSLEELRALESKLVDGQDRNGTEES